jgi:putative ABC transport system permease protein
MDALTQLADVLKTSLQQGLLYSILTLGLVFSFYVVRFPDLTVDGSFALGAAIAAAAAEFYGAPGYGLLAAIAAGGAAGLLTSALSVRFGMNRLLSGILVMTMLYSVCLRVMTRSNIPLKGDKNVFAVFEGKEFSYFVVTGIFLFLSLALYGGTYWLLKSEYGLYLRAVGPSADLVSAMGRNEGSLVAVGLILANSLVGLCGGLAAHQYGLADVNMGSGMLITGLAGLFLGRSLFRRVRSASGILAAALLGTFVYQLVKNGALRLGLNTNDLKLITAVLVVVALLFRKRGEDSGSEGSFV